MVEKCPNPTCAATFRRLRDGRLLVMEFEEDYRSAASGRVRQRQYVWLCNSFRYLPLQRQTGPHLEFSFRTELTVEIVHPILDHLAEAADDSYSRHRYNHRPSVCPQLDKDSA